MKRPVLTSFLIGALAGCGAAPMVLPMPAPLPQPVEPVAAQLLCWPTDDPLPTQFVGMTVAVIDAESRLLVLERDSRSVLIGEVVPGVSCVIGEGADA
jgi:hypothetical protein